MPSFANPYSLPLFASAISALIICVLTWRRRSAPGALPLFLMLITTVIWAGTNGMLLEANDSQSRFFWFNILIVGALFGSPAFLGFALQYTKREHLLTNRNIFLICIIPFISTILAWTNQYHYFFYTKLDFTTPLPSGGWQATPGIGYNFFLIYSYAVVLYSIAITTQAFIRAPRLYRGQTGTILIGTLIPLIGNIMHNFITGGPEKGAIDPTPILFTVMGAIYAYGLFSFRLFDIVPIARHTLVERMTDGVLVVDSKNRIVDINPAAIQMLRLTLHSPLGLFLNELAFPLPDSVTQHAQNPKFETEIKVSSLPFVYFNIKVETLFDKYKQTNGKLIVIRDITEKKQVEEKLYQQLAEIENLQIELREQAIKDSLTGLFNRRYLDEALNREVQRASRHHYALSVLMIEIDSFKIFNDAYGHEAGDRVLQKVAELIQSNIRADDIACRYGGDEFVLIMPETTTDSALQCAKRLHKDIEDLQLHHLEQSVGRITISIGVANMPQHNRSGELLLRAADKAMYNAKQAGKNRIAIASEMESHA